MTETVTSPSIRRVGLFCRFQRTPDIVSAVISLVKCLRVRGITIYTSAATAELSGIIEKKDILLKEPEEIAGADLAIVVGGDGTFINTARKIAPLGIPVLGINLGRIGYLTDVNVRGMVESMAGILDGGYYVEDRMMLHVREEGDGTGWDEQPAVNDVVIRSGEEARIVDLQLSIDGIFAAEQRCDGIIFATPTGSTAYSMAAGGPIIAATLDSITIVPLNPFSLTSRPLVVEPGSEIRVKLIKSQGALMHLDGQEGRPIPERGEVVVARHETSLRVVHPIGYDFYQNLRQKLHWTR